jgi:hypothetical protein
MLKKVTLIEVLKILMMFRMFIQMLILIEETLILSGQYKLVA